MKKFIIKYKKSSGYEGYNPYKVGKVDQKIAVLCENS